MQFQPSPAYCQNNLYLTFFNIYIEKYKNQYLAEGMLEKDFKEKFSYDIKRKENELKEVKRNFDSNVYDSKKELYKLVHKHEIEILMLNIKIMNEINTCDRRIYEIDQSFI